MKPFSDFRSWLKSRGDDFFRTVFHGILPQNPEREVPDYFRCHYPASPTADDPDRISEFIGRIGVLLKSLDLKN
jgi:hypothetical protein